MDSVVSPQDTRVVRLEIIINVDVSHFPSVSFAGLGFLSFYLAGKLHLFDRRGHAVRHSRFIMIKISAHLSVSGQSLVSALAICSCRTRGHFPYNGFPPYVQPILH